MKAARQGFRLAPRSSSRGRSRRTKIARISQKGTCRSHRWSRDDRPWSTARVCAGDVSRHEIEASGSLDLQRDKAVDHGGCPTALLRALFACRYPPPPFAKA